LVEQRAGEQGDEIRSLIDNFKCIIESLEMIGVEKGEDFKLHLNEAIKSIQKADRENMPAN
jgi:hypothetical protein